MSDQGFEEASRDQDARPQPRTTGIAKPGQWIYTREWQGPLLLVLGVTEKRLTCRETSGRRALLRPEHVVAVSDTKDGANAAQRAFLDTLNTFKAAELLDLKNRRSALRDQQTALEREIGAEARRQARIAADQPKDNPQALGEVG